MHMYKSSHPQLDLLMETVTKMAFVSNLDKEHDPTSIHEALWIPKWKEAITKEIKALEKNET